MGNPILEDDLKTITGADLPWQQLYGKTILVTGGSGFIASYIIRTLLFINNSRISRKIKIICLVRDKKTALLKFSKIPNSDRLIFWEQDVCAPVAYTLPIDYIIHAASYATPSKYGVDPVGTLLPNILGTYNVLEYSRTMSLKSFLFISSCEIYGNYTKGVKFITEDSMGSLDPVSLRSCYAESKRMGETMCVSWEKQYHVPTKIVRLFHTYGPTMSLNDGRVHSDFVSNIVNSNTIHINSDGKAERGFLYIADAVIGIFTVLLRGKNGEPYNVGNANVLSINKLANALVSFFPEKKLRVIWNKRKRGKGYLQSPVQKQVPDIRKMSDLGWKPRCSLRNGFTRTIESFAFDLHTI